MASPTRPPPRRSTPSSPSSASVSPPKSRTSPTPSIISKGATARSAVSPRASPPVGGRARAPSSVEKSSPVPNGDVHANGRDALVASLKRESDEKEELLVRLEEKDAQIASLTSDVANITARLSAAETRIAEFYADQSRMEEEMATRMEITEKLRAQLHDMEREKREMSRRYTEQTATFEAERQAFYDNEQHLKSRIQSLMAAEKARKEALERPSSPAPSIPDSSVLEELSLSPETPVARLSSTSDELSEPPEVTALKLELSTLSTSHSSLQVMVQMLQTELSDLKRVNNELQEENESYGLLLMERAMNGAGLDMLRQMGGDEHSIREDASSLSGERNLVEEGERASIRSSGRSTLDRVSEAEELALDSGDKQDLQLPLVSELQGQGLDMSPSPRRRRTRQTSASSSPRANPLGESLADLPITGPGLDLAAELGRAETKDLLDGNASGSIDQQSPSKARRTPRKMSEPAGDVHADREVLLQEIKSLKDANKALSLYASKIIDRIIMQEGFEQVLAVDYNAEDKPVATPKSPGAFEGVLAKAKEWSPMKPKTRPQSMLLARATTFKSSAPLSSHETTFKLPESAEPEKIATSNTSAPTAPDAKRNRRSLSFDWRSFSVFGGASNPVSDKERNLRPLTLRPGATSALSGARKLETQEDDDDKKERERLNATMKLMGIEKPNESELVPMIKSQSGSAAEAESETASLRSSLTSRFSFFRSKSVAATSTQSSLDASGSSSPANLTSEALQQAEAETSLASLDAREKLLTAEIAKGGSGGFTELHHEGGLSLGEQWRSRRARSSASRGSHESSGGSTVWSAGIKPEDE